MGGQAPGGATECLALLGWVKSSKGLAEERGGTGALVGLRPFIVAEISSHRKL